MRLTVQPMGAIPNQEFVAHIIDQMESEDMLMFATDYPHWHYDSEADAWPVVLPEPLNSKIWSENARWWYRL